MGLRSPLCFVTVLLVAVPALAQTAPSAGGSGLGMGRNQGGYVGLNVGQSDYRTGCGTALFGCDDRATSAQVYAGSMFRQNLGVELGYLHMGNASRGGGTTKAQGLNLSLVGRLPLGATPFSAVGKVGTTYGRTDTSAVLGSGLTSGRENGFGLSYGLGLNWDFRPNMSAVVAWDSHDFKFASSGRDAVRSTSLGLKYRY